MPMTDPIQPPPDEDPAGEVSAGQEATQFTPGLYLVATPIGNAADITLRALALLKRADLVACEDSRVSGPFLKRYGIQTPLFPYHEHNAAKVRPQLLQKLQAGAVVALVSDAGTPLISDPGYKLVRESIAAGIPVTALPGASAVLTALSLSGLPSDRFLFAGFPPAKAAAREKWLAELKPVRASLVLLESAQRLPDSLAAMAKMLGGAREAAVSRELTKKFEEVRRGSLADLAAHYAAHGPPRGEVTLVIGPPGVEAEATAADLDAALAAAMPGQPLRQAIDMVAAALGLPRKQVYARALHLRDSGSDDG
ncbi:MAG TPA: 16S rRNA (cytidine(1402)-2'-O)-methyltransferase [Ferrovibrio sp.]|uniref:16S rRNA (cytidine(1402)-2'-O)-methyltransferase n=1 Tax=Ferrovibrio sp. TaxID=1917215 RepID=UPI002ED0D5AE